MLDSFKVHHVQPALEASSGTNTTIVVSAQNQQQKPQTASTEEGEKKKKVSSVILLFIGKVIYMYWHYFLFNAREIRKRKIGFVLGLSSVLIVVLAVCISLSALAQLPIIFLRLAENNNGEVDMILRAKSYLPGSTLNITAVETTLKYGAGEPVYRSKFQYFSPRYVFNSGTTSYSGQYCRVGNTSLPLTPDDIGTYIYGANSTDACALETVRYCVQKYCSRFATSSLYVIDTERERNMKLGRDWKYKALNTSVAYISSGLAASLLLDDGDSMLIRIDTSEHFAGPFREASIITSENEATPAKYTIFFPVTVQILKGGSKRKVSIYESDTIFMEYEHFMSSISPYIHPEYTEDQRFLLSQVNLYEYAQQIVYNLPPNRITKYNKQQFTDIKKMVTQFASSVLYYNGFDQMRADYPMLNYMEQTTFFSLFLGLIVNIIIVILSVLSLILIYSLLMINVENRTFELGVMRMIGTQRIGILQLIFMQAMFFAIPGVILGLVLGQLGYLLAAFILSKVLGMELSKLLGWVSVLVSVLLGIFIPIISSILPIRNALTLNLSDSLDTTRSKTKSVKYSIERSSDGKVSFPLIALGVIGAVLGFGTYYFFPLALLSFNLTLLLYMFFAVLVAMLLGLAVLALNLESAIEQLITFVLFFWENEAIRHLIIKNLIAHRERNRKTTIMLSMSLGFIIFISIAFNLQVQTFNYGQAQIYGTRLNVETGSSATDRTLLEKLELLCKNSTIVNGRFTYISRPLDIMYSETRIQSKGRHVSGYLTIYAVPPNFLNVVKSRFLKVTEQQKGDIRSYNVVKQLYTERGSHSVLLGTRYKKYLNMKHGIDSTVIIRAIRNLRNGFPIEYHTLLKPLAFLNSAPVLSFSKYPGREDQDGLISFPTFLRLTKGEYTTVDQIPIARMFIEVNNGVSPKKLKELKTNIKSILFGYPSARLKDLDDELSPIRIAIQAINFFFLFTAAVAMFICFFSLMSSQYTNVQEQTKEIAVLRAIGVTRFKIVRLFIYESFVLVLTASIMGVAIGFIVAYTMSAQSFLFTQLPLDPIIPWEIMLLVIGLAFVFSVISAVFPTIALLRLPIVVLLKRII